MNTEEIRLLRENNAMLKQIVSYINGQRGEYGKDFLINVFANLAAD